MNKFFQKKQGFKKGISILLLLVFVLGITPKKTLHTWFANHTDSSSKIPESKTPQISKGGFNCQLDDLVAESHFISFGTLVVVNLPSIHSFFSLDIPCVISLSSFHNNLRGPPSRSV
ncbi:MAG: hypothetical protein ABIY62_03130 [Ginsengibacter sp.]